ncbi:hypothetical protein OIV83_005272 [Microbotryomycetes sp. JL201]|nr:hypothetical protein OIV83_005272 [Microbotryomycetes sp. JL201]
MTGALVLAIGPGSAFLGPLQTKWGMRPVFLLSAIMALIGQVWAGASKYNFPSLIGARVVQGLGMSAYFNNVPAAIEAIYFVHERGTRMALWNLALVGGINLGPVISSQICQRQGWQFAFWWQAVACGIVLLGTIGLVPEMMYDRTYYVEACEKRRRALDNGSSSPSQDFDEKTSDRDKEAAFANVVPADVNAAPTSRWGQYRFCTGVKSDTSFLKLLLRPVNYVYSPTVLWATLTFSVCFNLLPLAATVYGQIFGAPPYNLSVGGIGLVGGVPPLIGTLIGTFATGPVSDAMAKWLSKRNQGIYEPEYQSTSWVAPAIFIAILHIGVSAATISSFSYIADALRDGAADALGFVVLIKSIIGFGIAFFVNDWYAARGPRQFFVSLGSLVVATSALSVPAWIFGKRARHWFSMHNVLSERGPCTALA